ncbi:atlastin-2-like [Paramacrobiotus metropolitanus]|uniref:atlastin-2-like n=1 Tax=Paramacrobiotus metropolitanus TaxID=2943436 RepID=UPI002446538F|nr:atlastin-2-like [Paramacrobiotus metropolitanus]XP_055329600.1 atlastin-2-like [Paramacrobiotus metropolitanus]XP_055329607.1 atlastin-2-like [Paramacrobiotus metropolitanus]XP_055329615.1 atlastin-2-like [Paramacrobiotus metropolitanus]
MPSLVDEEVSGPAPLQIVIAQDDHTFALDEEALSDLLLRKDVVNKRIVLISVAGAFRKGKSFLLDFMLRFLRAGERLSEEELRSGSWLGNENQALTGFHWRGGSERDTTGILLWNEPFFRKLPNGEEVVVLIMDTQGAFDTESTVKDCATVFALSTMISSVQMYNLSANIQEDDLQHLQLFTEYGRLAMEKSTAKPFQELIFLVRDWSFPYESDYGIKGGQELLEKRLQISDRQHPELQQLRRHIRSCFDKIQCFLMPHPGLRVATNPKFDGRLSDIEADFKRCLVELMPLVLSQAYLVPKEINGQKITGRELLEYFKSYIKIYQSDTLPEPKSMLEATAEANNLSAVNAARELYMERMEAICGGEQPYLNPQSLEHEHTLIQGAAVQRFKDIPKMGGDEFSASYLKKLEDELFAAYGSFMKHNESKNFFSSFRTPATLFVVIVVLYVISGFLDLIGLLRYANFFALVMGVVITAVVTWGVCRLTGSAREVGQAIDEVATWIWENVLSPLTQQAGQRMATAYPQYQHMVNVGNVTVNAGKMMSGADKGYRPASKQR